MKAKIILYGHRYCPQVRPVRALLEQSGVTYDYVDIRTDEDGRMRVKEINAGNESVPTLEFSDGSTLTEPSQKSILTHLGSLGYDLPPLATFDRILIQLINPQIIVFGVVLVLSGWVLDVLPLVAVGVILVLLPFIVRFIRK